MTQSEKHDWFKPQFVGYECCRKCGIIRRADDKNKPCKGIVRVALRSYDREDER